VGLKDLKLNELYWLFRRPVTPRRELALEIKR
jgi:hypothetical protein